MQTDRVFCVPLIYSSTQKGETTMFKIITSKIRPVCCTLATALLVALATAHSASADFTSSCQNINIQGTTLTASCYQVNDNRQRYLVPASINLDTVIGNTEGVLTWGGSQFSSSCKGIELQPPKNVPKKGEHPPVTAILQADCTKSFVFTVPATLNLDERIYNSNGSLIFR